MKNRSLLVATVLSTVILCFGAVAMAQTPTIAQLQAQIQALMQQLQTIQGQPGTAITQQAWCHTFSNYLVAGLTDSTTNGEVSFLQTALTKSGFDVAGDPQGTFGDSTAAAVVQFQGKNQITQTGTVGPKTRAQLNALYGCGPNQTAAQAETPVATPVTPQVQPSTTANTTLCNNVYYSACPTATTFVCPSTGVAFCQAQNSTTQTPVIVQNTQNSPFQNGATPPPDCVGKTATTSNLPQDCQIYFGLLQQPANNPQNFTSSQLPNQALCMIYGPFSKNAPSMCSNMMGSAAPLDCMGIFPTSDSQVPSDCKTFITTQMMQGGGKQTNIAQSPMHCMFYTPFSANTPSECKQYQGVTVPSDCVGIQPTSSSNLPADCVAFMQKQMQNNQPQNTQQQNNPQNSPQQNGATPPPDCVGKTTTTANLPQDCQIYFGLITQPVPPQNSQTQNQTSLSPQCGGPGQVWCPSPVGTGGWCQLPPCSSAMPQSGPSQTNANGGSPQQNGATPPPDCVGKTATTANLPQDCQIYFGLISQPVSANFSQNGLSSISNSNTVNQVKQQIISSTSQLIDLIIKQLNGEK